MPPGVYRLMADVDAALVQQILDVSEREWKANLHHHRQADDLRAGLEVAKWRSFGHRWTVRNRPTRLKPDSFDSAPWAQGAFNKMSPTTAIHDL